VIHCDTVGSDRIFWRVFRYKLIFRPGPVNQTQDTFCVPQQLGFVFQASIKPSNNTRNIISKFGPPDRKYSDLIYYCHCIKLKNAIVIAYHSLNNKLYLLNY